MELDIFVADETFEEQVLEMLETIRPHWQKSQVELKKLTGGVFNKVLSACNSQHPDDVLAVKVFTPASTELVDHGAEYALLQFLSQNTDLLQLDCKFSNGYVYKYYPGRILEKQDLEKEENLRKMYDQLHSVHSQVIPATMDKRALEYDSNIYFVAHYINILKSERAAELDSVQRFVDAGITRQKLLEIGDETMKEYKELRERLPTVLCHGDSRVNNFIIDDATGDIRLIDWDLVSLGPEIPDLVAVFNRQRLYNPKDPSDAVRFDKFLKLYVETHPMYAGQDISTDTFNTWKKDFMWTSYVMEKWMAVDYAGIHVAFGKDMPSIDLLDGMMTHLKRAEDFKDIYEKLE